MSDTDSKFDRAYELHRAGRGDEAARLYQEVVTADPRHARAWHQLACLVTANEPERSVEMFLQALRLDGGMASWHNNLGETFRALGRLNEAARAYQQAIRLDPQYVTPRVNLCQAYLGLGKTAEAERAAGEALALSCRSADEHCAAAALRLLRGDLAAGFDELEWRLQLPGTVRPALPGAAWGGAPLAGQEILLYAEQGLGDTLQFVRYLPQVIARGGRPILAVQRSLLPLLRANVTARVVPIDEPLPVCPWHVALLSLPKVLGTTLTTVPSDVPYLHATEELVELWRPRLEGLAGFRVGIGWQGNRRYRFDRQRSIPLVEFAPLAKVGDVRLVSLQRESEGGQLSAVKDEWNVVDLGGHLDHQSGAFMDTAAVMMHLDLIVTSDTSIAHLAGALGRPVWVALPMVPDWRWLLDREDCPWYPTMRLFRQCRSGDWPEVFQRLASELAVLASKA